MTFRRFSLAALVYTLPVILWGAYVRASRSGDGCGDHWPMCPAITATAQPAANTHTLIEFAHRASSGLAGIVAVVLCVWAFRVHARGSHVRAAAAASLFFMVLESAVGAALVKLQLVASNATVNRAAWMGIHLVNTFLLIAAMTLTAAYAAGMERPRLSRNRNLSLLLGSALALLVVLGVSGAITALGDTLFPAANLLDGLQSDFAPTAHVFVRLRVWHPVLALVTGCVVTGVAFIVANQRPNPVVRRAAAVLGILFLTQLGLGVMNIVLLAPAWLQLVHLLCADLVWITLVVLTAAALATERPAPEAALAPAS